MRHGGTGVWLGLWLAMNAGGCMCVYYAGGRGGRRVYVIPTLEAVVVRLGRIRNDFDDGEFLNPVLRTLRSSVNPGSS